MLLYLLIYCDQRVFAWNYYFSCQINFDENEYYHNALVEHRAACLNNDYHQMLLKDLNLDYVMRNGLNNDKRIELIHQNYYY